MNKLAEYIRLILFIAALLCGLQLPGFVDQYGKSLHAHLNEAKLSLAEFQDDADKYFNGDLEALIEHYLSSNDQVFNEGGQSIQAIYQRHKLLESALLRYKENAYSPYYQSLLEPLPDIQREVWKSFTHTVVLDSSAIGVGIVSGILVILVFSLFTGVLKLIGRLFGVSSSRIQNMRTGRG